MRVPEFFQGSSIARLVQGAAVGALATTVIGFNWGGWVTSSHAEKMKSDAVEASLVTVYAPICVKRYAAEATAEQRAAFAKESEWMRDTFIEKAGFATAPGSRAPSSAVADACADALSKQLKATAATQNTKG